MTIKDFVKWLYPVCVKSEVNAVFTIAQAALESGWGTKAIGNNLFGVTKGSSWQGSVQLVNTTEYFRVPNRSFKPPEKVMSVIQLPNNLYKYRVKRLFRDYDTLMEGILDHERILKNNFSDAWIYKDDPVKFLEHIQDNIGLKYATSPDYVTIMKRLFVIIEKELNNNLTT